MIVRNYFKQALTAACALALATPALALDVDVTPTPELGVEKTYTVTIKNDGNSILADLSAEDIFGYAITLDSEPMAEYYAFFVSAGGWDTKESGRVHKMSMLSGTYMGAVSFATFENTASSDLRLTGLALHPTTGEYYVLFGDEDNCNRCLFKLNLNTATATYIATMNKRYSSLAFDSNGTLWTLDGNEPDADYDGDLLTINIANGVTTLVLDNPAGLDNGYEHTLAYNPDDGKMYYFDLDDIYTFNPEAVSPTLTASAQDVTDGVGPTDDYEINAAFYIGGGQFLVGNAWEEEAFNFIMPAGPVTSVVAFSTNDGIDSRATKGIIPSGYFKNSLTCTGSGAAMECLVPYLVPAGEVKLTVTGTLYEAPEDTTDTTDDDDSDDDVTDTTDDDVTDTTDDDDKKGGGCSVAGNGSGFGHDLLLLALAAGAVLAWRRRLA